MAGRNERELKVVVTGEDRGATRALGKVETASKKIGPASQVATNGIESVSSALTSRLGPAAVPAEAALNKLGTAAIASGGALKAGLVGGVVVATAALGAFAAAGVSSARDQNEALSKSNEVFGQSAAAIEKWAAGADRSFGQSKKGALEAAGTFGNMFSQLGIGESVAADMSKTMTELASDFVAFHGGNVTDAIAAQTAAFRGEYDAVQRFVPTINAAAVEQQALAMGLATSTKELTAQDKALATYQLLVDGAGKATGNFDATSGDLAQQQRILTAQVDNLSAQFGQALIPVLSELAGAAIPVVNAISGLTDKAGGLAQVITNAVEAAFPLLAVLKLLPGDHKKGADEATKQAKAVEKLSEKLPPAAADFENYSKAQEKLADTSDKLAKAERDAADAPAKAARARAEAAENVEDAQRSLADAQEAAADSVVSANRRIEDSQRSLDDAHRRELDAQESLAEARKGAAEDLEDLRHAQERNTLAVERAALNVDKANQGIGKAKTLSEEKDARLGLREAELSLSEAQEKRREDAEALNQAEANGIEGSRRVVDAKRSVQDAIRAVGDAERSVTDAMAAATKAQSDGARSVEQAQRALRDAVQSVADVARSSLDEQIEKERVLRDSINERTEALNKLAEAAAKIGLNLPAAAALESRLVPGRFQSFADGGVVQGPRGAAMPAIVHGGEGVLNLAEMDAMARGGTANATPANVTINNTFQVTGEMSAFDRWELDRYIDSAMQRNADEISRLIGSH